MKSFLIVLNKISYTIFVTGLLLTNNAVAAPAKIYTSTAQSSQDGYIIDLSRNAKISNIPTVGTDGVYYYKVGDTYVISDKGLRPSGRVNCTGAFYQEDASVKPVKREGFHRIFTYIPRAPGAATINGLPLYQLSFNTFVTIYSNKGMVDNWINYKASICQTGSGTATMKSFVYQFPFEVSVYVKKRNLDGITVIPSAEFAGYSRAYSTFPLAQTMAKLPQMMPVSSVTAPMRLIGGTIISPAECRTDVGGSLIINHGVLNAEKYESRVVRPINFSCDHVVPTPVEFELLYTKDGDPQQRLPLKVDGTNSTIYSKIEMIDAETGNRGQKFTSRVGQYKQIQIESILKGTNASGGNYSGTAVLIAAYP
ncbi:hypothetical protein [Proteus vulgaris]|uniref:Adhesin n=1 Tax=Proteus vulgaris TaxID=585 RepID=A0A6G6SI13_PROVU|nr:hypothetical protein [Proteus vulgaris]QIF92689.1 hypothetical protein GTH24_01765 [Proteus vulgaris]